MTANLFGAIGSPAPGKTDTSREAAAVIAPHTSGLQRKVYACILAAGTHGRTPDECCLAMAPIHDYSIRRRLTELRKAGLIFATQERREDRRGRKEIVYIA